MQIQNTAQHGSPGMGITRSLPNEDHCGLPNTDPLMGGEVGAAHEALPAVQALTELPFLVAPLV